jgi:hypothetical protein
MHMKLGAKVKSARQKVLDVWDRHPN